MKPTIKISIGGFAYNLEEDAYQELGAYLSSLDKHFKNNPEKDEIISDVEIRISELLQMRLTDSREVVSLEDIRHIKTIIGNPKDFGDEEENIDNDSKSKTKPFFTKKKLYRDMDNSIVGGVLSGLGKYFHIDPVILRIIYIAIFLILWFAAHKTGFFWLLAYAALWVVVPKAKTLDQKLAMQGADPSIENIENREEVSFNKPRNSGFGKVLKIISGIILGCIALGILISIIAVVAVFTGLYSASDFPSINEGLNLIGLNSFDFKLSFIAIIALPLIGLLYLCIKFLFQIRFTKKDAIISVIAFILWIGVSAYFGGTMYRYAKPYQKDYSVIQTIPITTLSDTLYVKLPPLYLKATPMFDSENIFYLENDNRKISSFIMPDIIIKKDTSCLNYQIEIKKHAKAATKRQALLKAEQAMFDYIIKDSLFIIRPRIYNKNNPWDREFFTIYITSPINKTVIVDELR